MQKTLTLIIAAVIFYIIVQTKIYPPAPESPKNTETVTDNTKTVTSSDLEQPNNPLTGNFIEKTISKVIINALKTEEGRQFFENLVQPMNKPISTENYTIEVQKDLIQPLFKINTFGVGSVGPASCGHVVTVRYQIADTENNLLTEDTKTFTLGSRPIMPGMDSVVVGMMVGQTRQAIIPAKYAYYNEKYRQENINPDSPYRLNVMLQSILPKNFVNNSEIKIFDDEIAYRIPLLCGDQIVFDAKVTRLSNGEILYDSKEKDKKIDMKIGDINYPLIFAYSLFGKVPVGTRTVIAKGSAFKSLGSGINKIIPSNTLIADEYLMLELNNFKIN